MEKIYSVFDLEEILFLESQLKKMFDKELQEETNKFPHKQTIANLLNYSKALSVKKTSSVGDVFKLLN
ncbi:MAG: hypothetical protein D6707_00170 [Bacteroidetes bacterium]|nr:MAG: hypothetical protein D6707_00170 [Bacteroidota bacterium]